ncbi:hypothetical protein [Escherichia coli]|uniref:hypothetical protein n=1 Tax=Escherichia coli TaxID=562 RepID=UPI000F266D75|nr:hypothetical protein [Escherichia coli]VCV29167.1 Mechanosensitive channel MscK [Escherichia coli]
MQQDLTDTLATLDKIDRIKEEVQLRQKSLKRRKKCAGDRGVNNSDVDNDEETRKILSTLSLRQLKLALPGRWTIAKQNDLASYNSQLVSLQTQPERVQMRCITLRSSCNKFAVVWMGLMSADSRPSQKVLMQAQQALLNAEIDQQRKSTEGNTVLQDTLQQRDYVTANSARLEHQLQLLQEAVNKRLTLTEKRRRKPSPRMKPRVFRLIRW